VRRPWHIHTVSGAFSGVFDLSSLSGVTSFVKGMAVVIIPDGLLGKADATAIRTKANTQMLSQSRSFQA
jgi:hypothetical protein